MAGTGLGDLKSYIQTYVPVLLVSIPHRSTPAPQIWQGLGVLESLKIKCQYLGWGWEYKRCLERGRWLNFGWNEVKGFKIVYPNTCASFIGQYPSSEYPGLQKWHGLGVLESKTHNFYMHFLFKQTYIQIINIFHYLSLFVYYIGKKCC